MIGYTVEAAANHPGSVRVAFPNGTVLFYDDDAHAYYVPSMKDPERRGKRIASVSSLVKPFDFNPTHLMRWAARQTGEGVARLSAKNGPGNWLDTGERVMDALEREGLTYEHLRDAKATVGTNVHLALEDLCSGKWPDPSAYPEAEGPYVSAVLRWWTEREPTPILSEAFIYSGEHGYAGRFDLLADVAGTTTLVDLKTSGYIGQSYLVQLAGYALAAKECGLGTAERLLVLQVKPDGTWAEVESPATGDDFLLALNTYRRSGELERAARAARNAA